SVTMLVAMARFFFLQSTAIGQADPAQGGCPFGAKNWSAKTLRNQSWKVADVIGVRMGEDDRINRTWFDGERSPVPIAQFTSALEKTAVYKNALASKLQHVSRPGNRPGGTI